MSGSLIWGHLRFSTNFKLPFPKTLSLDNRNYLIGKLQSIGLNDIIVPKGAFYLYLNISKIHSNSYDFCKSMVDDIGVTLAPGIDFDDKNGKNYVRFSYACKKTELEEALNLIKNWL